MPYVVVGSSVLGKECDEVFLKCHIWLLDRQCHRKIVTPSFPKLLLGCDKLSCTRSSNMGREALLRNCINSVGKEKCQKKGK